jgi:predicted nucleic acid-binding protein
VAEPFGYVDTSALLKWYVAEPGSEAVADWIERQPALAFSRLGWLEFRCAVNRRRRGGDLDAATAADVLERFFADVEDGAFTLLPLADAHALAADDLIARLATPLRTLDALHLATAMAHRAESIATADLVLSRAAHEVGMTVVYFGQPR